MESVRHIKQERYYRYVLPVFFVLLDYIAILLAEEAAFGLRGVLDLLENGEYMIASSYIYFWIPLIFILFLEHSRTYKQMQPILETIKEIFYAVCYGLITCILLLYFMKASLMASRLYVVLFGILVLFNIYVLRYVARKFMKTYKLFPEPIILVGGQKTAEVVLRYFENDLGYRYNLVGIIDDCPQNISLKQPYLLLGNTAKADIIVKKSGVKTVIITAPGMQKERLQLLISKIQPYVRNISFVPDLIGTPMGNVTVDNLFSEKVILLKIQNNLARKRNRIVKRIFDLILSCLLCTAILPIIFVLGVLIKLDSKGPVFFNAERIGRRRKNFTCYKFRSMYVDSDEILQKYLSEHPQANIEWTNFAKLREHDPRVTRIGAWMRKYSLDELPQIFNVLLGNMSLVGPRPYLPREQEKIGDAISTISLIVPGITGLWQVSGRNDVTFVGRVEMDIWYVRNWSVWIDLMYLFKTIKVVFCGKGAY